MVFIFSLFHPLRVLIATKLMQHEFGRVAVAVSDESDLGIYGLEEVVAVAFREDFKFGLSGACT